MALNLVMFAGMFAALLVSLETDVASAGGHSPVMISLDPRGWLPSKP